MVQSLHWPFGGRSSGTLRRRGACSGYAGGTLYMGQKSHIPPSALPVLALVPYGGCKYRVPSTAGGHCALYWSEWGAALGNAKSN